MLHVVQTRVEFDPASPDRVEDELVRRGARGARALGDGAMAVTVAARTRGDAVALVHDLIARMAETVRDVAAVR